MSTPKRAGRAAEGAPDSSAGDWLDEHLKFTVPLRMHEIATRVIGMGPSATGLTYAERVRNIGIRDFRVAGFTGQVPSTIPALIATTGDALFGESKLGRAADLAAALTTGIAAAALVQVGGITYRGHHWCRALIHYGPSCSCGYVEGECETCALRA